MSISSPIIAESLQHGQCVAKAAIAIFEGLKPLHKLGDNWAAILHKGAQLHDIGWLYGKQGHHKASAAMIRAGHVEKVPKDIRNLVAMVARYHRRADPSERHWRFAALSTKQQKAMLYLAAIIRLADALDFSHTGCVQDITAHIRHNTVYLELACSHNCQAEINRIQAKKQLFVHVFGHDVCAGAI